MDFNGSVKDKVLSFQADEDQILLAELRPQRDTLKKELEVLEKELKEGV